MRWGVLIAAMMIAGCAGKTADGLGSTATNEATMHAIVQTAQACVAQLDSDPRFSNVTAKLRDGVREYASPDEAVIIHDYAGSYFHCQQHAINDMIDVSAFLLNPLIEARRGATARYRALAAGQITYAETATQARVAGEVLSANLQRAWSDYMSEAQAAEEQHTRNNLVAVLALLAAGAVLAQSYHPPPIYPPYRPVQTTCMRMGDIMNCQSY